MTRGQKAGDLMAGAPVRNGLLGELRWCAGCAGEQLFEVPPCQDGHGLDCPDRACVSCGHALVVGLVAADGIVVDGRVAADDAAA